MEKIKELYDRLKSLTAEEMDTLRAAVLEEFDRVHGEETTAENVTILNELAQIGTGIQGENAAREQAQAEAETAKAAAADAISGLRPSETDDGGEAAEEEAPAEVPVAAAPVEDAEETDEEKKAKEAVTAEEPAAEEVAEQVAVTASGVAAVRAGRRTAVASPEAAEEPPKAKRVLLASSFAGEYDHLDNRDAINHALADQLGRMMRDGPPRGVALVASQQWEYPEDRRLGKDAELNGQIMEATSGVNALLASGGICLPVNVDYGIETWATQERPLRDGLTSYSADRGGLRFVQPPSLGPLGAATGIWTQATDANPGASTKPVFSVACGTEELVYVAAVSTRVGFGNMQSRFQPELVAANTDLAMAAAARKAEINLLELIQAACLKEVTNAKVLGATRDLITAMTQAAAHFRYTNRIPRALMLTGVFPDWVKDVIKIDIAREGAHQQTNDWNSLMITEDQVVALIKNAGINPIFTVDALPTQGANPEQALVTLAKGAMPVFPTKCVWDMFPEGSMQFLDGGRLDLGVVRDSTLDATNDYETFVETFEGIANRGFANAATQFVTELCANGKSGATETVSTCA